MNVNMRLMPPFCSRSNQQTKPYTKFYEIYNLNFNFTQSETTF